MTAFRMFNRRIIAAGVLGAASMLPAPIAYAQQGLDHRELAADQQIIHALNRLTFGARPGDVQSVRAIGLEAWIDRQLQPGRIPDGATDRVLSRYSILQEDQNDLLREYNAAAMERRAERRADSAQDSRKVRRARQAPGMDGGLPGRRAVIGQLQSARVARAVTSERQLEEVMTDFWLNHFNVFAQKGPPEPYYLVDYERSAIRPNVLGKFRDLLGAVAKSPAMLFYLDNARSMGDSTRPRLATVDRRQRRRMPRQQRPLLERLRKGGLNENYGRELLELHTLGVDGGYSQQDVIDVARALTGWTIRPPAAGGGFVFRPEMHDAGDKTVLGVRLEGGRGIEDGEQVLDIVARHPATAKFIARKLAVRFVSDSPPEALVARAAEVFRRTDGDIREVMRTIVTSNEFYSRSVFRSKVKSPFEVVVSAVRAMNAQADSTPRTAQVIAYLGQPIYGHQAPNGYPETGDAWMNAGAILNRINFGIAAASNRIPGAAIGSLPGIDSLRNASREKQVDAVTSMLLGGSVSPETRAVLISGENPLLARVAAGAENTAMTPENSMDEDVTMRPRNNPLGRRGSAPALLSGVAQVVGLAIGSPEFQRR